MDWGTLIPIAAVGGLCEGHQGLLKGRRWWLTFIVLIWLNDRFLSPSALYFINVCLTFLWIPLSSQGQHQGRAKIIYHFAFLVLCADTVAMTVEAFDTHGQWQWIRILPIAARVGLFPGRTGTFAFIDNMPRGVVYVYVVGYLPWFLLRERIELAHFASVPMVALLSTFIAIYLVLRLFAEWQRRPLETRIRLVMLTLTQVLLLLHVNGLNIHLTLAAIISFAPSIGLLGSYAAHEHLLRVVDFNYSQLTPKSIQRRVRLSLAPLLFHSIAVATVVVAFGLRGHLRSISAQGALVLSLILISTLLGYHSFFRQEMHPITRRNSHDTMTLTLAPRVKNAPLPFALSTALTLSLVALHWGTCLVAPNLLFNWMAQ